MAGSVRSSTVVGDVLLIAPEAPLATHGENDWLTPGADWAEIAAELSR